MMGNAMHSKPGASKKNQWHSYPFCRPGPMPLRRRPMGRWCPSKPPCWKRILQGLGLQIAPHFGNAEHINIGKCREIHGNIHWCYTIYLLLSSHKPKIIPTSNPSKTLIKQSSSTPISCWKKFPNPGLHEIQRFVEESEGRAVAQFFAKLEGNVIHKFSK